MKSVHDMITYLDTETERDTRYEVVSYLLAHLRDLDSLSLSEVARQTYVSKSTVSRVVRRFGFESYDEFLAVTRRLVRQDPSVTLRIAPNELHSLRSGDGGYIDSYIDELCTVLQDLKSTVDAETIDSLIKDMMSRETALFATEQPLMIARDVQVAFLAAGRLIHVGETGNKRRQIAQELPSGSLAVVLSNYGRYLEDNRETLEGLKGRGVELWLVTLCYDGPSCLLFDRIIRLSAHGFSGVGSFPMKAFFKLVIRRLLAGEAAQA